jgi:tyrosine-protein phosphatase OCA1
MVFFPPVNFSPVEEGLYRSGLPSEINYPFLERLGLRTILYLFPDEIDAQL